MTPRKLDGHRDRPARMVFVDRDHFGCTCGAPAAGPRCAGRECDNSQPRPTGLRPVRLPRAAQLLPRTARCAGAVVLRRQQLDASHLVTGGGSPDLRSSLSTARTSARPPGPKWAAALGTAQPAATSKVNLDGASASIRPRVYGVLLMRPHVTTNRAGLAAMSSPTRRACDQALGVQPTDPVRRRNRGCNHADGQHDPGHTLHRGGGRAEAPEPIQGEPREPGNQAYGEAQADKHPTATAPFVCVR